MSGKTDEQIIEAIKHDENERRTRKLLRRQRKHDESEKRRVEQKAQKQTEKDEEEKQYFKSL